MSALTYQVASIPLRLASAGTVVVLPILTLQQIDDVAVGGFLASAALFPSVVAAPYVGAILDRMRHPRRLLVLAAGLTAFSYIAAAFVGDFPTPLIAALLLLAGLTTPVYMGGLSSFATDVIADRRAAYAQDSLSYTIASVGGPAVAALMIGIATPRAAMVLMSALALVGAAGSLGVTMKPRPTPAATIHQTIASGVTYLIRHRPIMIVTLAGTTSQVAGGALGVAAVALSVERVQSSVAAPAIVTAFAVGGLIGALAIAFKRWSTRPPEWVMGVGFAATGVFILAAVPDLGIYVALAMMVLAGVWTAPANAAMLYLRDEQSPPAVKSQVFTIGAGLRAAAAAVGAAWASSAFTVGAVWLFLGIGTIWIGSGLMLKAYPRPRTPPKA